MNVYSIETKDKSRKELKNLTKVDLDDEVFAIASNSQDQIAFGGTTNKVDLHNLGDGSAIGKESLASPALGFNFTSSVQRLQWVGRFIIGYPETDFEVQMYDTETEKVFKFKNEASPKSGALDPLGQYFASTALDGHLTIFKVPNEESESIFGTIIKRIKITKQKQEPFGTFPF
jgi:hypothetical protein